MESIAEKKAYYARYSYDELLEAVITLADANHALIQKLMWFTSAKR